MKIDGIQLKALKLLGQWSLCTIVGFAVGITLGGITSSAVSVVITLIPSEADIVLPDPIVKTILNGVFGCIFGSSIGIMQWLVLRRHLQRAYRWILVNIAWITIGTIIATAIHGNMSSPASVILNVVAFSSFALLQGFILWRRAYAVGLWVLANAIGWGLGALATKPIELSISNLPGTRLEATPDTIIWWCNYLGFMAAQGIGYGVTFAAVIGAVTGCALVFLLSHQADQDKPLGSVTEQLPTDVDHLQRG